MQVRHKGRSTDKDRQAKVRRHAGKQASSGADKPADGQPRTHAHMHALN